MRSDTAPAGRRLVITLSAVSAVMVVTGGILLVAGAVTHHPGSHIGSLGVALGVAGLAVGLVTLLVFAFTRGGRSARRRPASHRRRAAPSAAPGRERGRALNPTTVYSPGGLIDVPREVRASASEGAARTPGFPGPTPATPAGATRPPGAARPAGSPGTREAFRAPTASGPPRGGAGEARPSVDPGRMGAAPQRPGYQAGAHRAPGAGPGWGPPGPAARPGQQPMPPPPGRLRPGDASPPRAPREAVPPRDAPAFSAGPPRGAPPFREGPLPRPGPMRPGPPPRHGNPARDAREPWRPDAPVPPFEPAPPSRGPRPGPYGPGPESGTGRPARGPGYGPAGGRRTAPPGAPGEPGRAGPGGTFDGGYAQVIRPADHPVGPASRIQPNPGRPAGPARPAGSVPPADRDVYVYRDVSDPVPKPSARHAAADDAAYWYDLLAEDPAPRPEATRGPFEPLLSSSGTSGAPPGTAGQQPGTDQARPPGDDHLEPPEQARARKLEQLKDLYLTAEAIGEQNVDKHFDLLLAQQRELISEYFRQSASAQPGGTSPRDGQAAETGPRHQRPGGQAAPPEGAGVRAEPPHAW